MVEGISTLVNKVGILELGLPSEPLRNVASRL